MGMPAAFADAADFSGMTKDDELKISNIIHKAFMEVVIGQRACRRLRLVS